MRFSLKTLLALVLLVALTYRFVLPAIFSERYYVISTLHIKGWDLTRMQGGELNKIIPYLPLPEELKKDESGEDLVSYVVAHKIDGVTLSAQPFGVAFETDSTRWHNAKAIRKVHQEMRAF